MRLGDIITKIVEIATAPIKELTERIGEVVDAFEDKVKGGLRKFLYSVLCDDVEVLNDFIKEVVKVYPQYEELWKKEKAKIEKGDTGAIGLAGIFLGSIIGGGISMGFSGFGRDIQNAFNTWRPVMPLSPSECAYFLNRNPTETEKVEEWLKANGYDTDKHYTLIQMYKPKLSISEIVTGYLRGVFDEKEFNYLLSEHGLSERDIGYLKGIMYDYPSPTDFIRFAVRDVFVEDKEIKKALEAEFPEGIVDYAEKAGLKREQLMWYWKAHWELPSPTQVYEMLHRLNPDVLAIRGKAYEGMGLDLDNLKLTLDDVKTYLRQADYDVRWRQRLVAISYSPLTRVDLRRIYALGLISDEELIARLMELGYTKEDAQLIAEFYKQYTEEEGREWTKSEIKYLLYYGIINEAQAKLYLMDLGYSEESAGQLIELWKAKLEEKDLREAQKYVRDAFAEGLITEEEARTQLKELGLAEEVIDVILAKEEKRRQRSYKNPSPDKVVKWLKAEIITEQEARNMLKELNVREKWIDYYIKEGLAK